MNDVREPLSSYDGLPIFLITGELGEVTRRLALAPFDSRTRMGVWLGQTAVSHAEALALCDALARSCPCVVMIGGLNSELLHDTLDDVLLQSGQLEKEVVLTGWDTAGPLDKLVFDTVAIPPAENAIEDVKSFVFICIEDAQSRTLELFLRHPLATIDEYCRRDTE